jgi:hypothetical protein
VANFDQVEVKSERRGARGEEIAVAEHHQARPPFAPREAEADIRPDTGRLAGGDGNNVLTGRSSGETAPD